MKETQNNEILAALSAAIAVFSKDSSCKLVVRSIKRIPQSSPVWNMTGRMDIVRNKLI